MDKKIIIAWIIFASGQSYAAQSYPTARVAVQRAINLVRSAPAIRCVRSVSQISRNIQPVVSRPHWFNSVRKIMYGSNGPMVAAQYSPRWQNTISKITTWWDGLRKNVNEDYKSVQDNAFYESFKEEREELEKTLDQELDPKKRVDMLLEHLQYVARTQGEMNGANETLRVWSRGKAPMMFPNGSVMDPEIQKIVERIHQEIK